MSAPIACSCECIHCITGSHRGCDRVPSPCPVRYARDVAERGVGPFYRWEEPGTAGMPPRQ